MDMSDSGFIFEMQGHIREMLDNWQSDVSIIVVTDGSRILGNPLFLSLPQLSHLFFRPYLSPFPSFVLLYSLSSLSPFIHYHLSPLTLS